MNFARQPGGRFAPRAAAANEPGEAIEALEAPHGEAAQILERGQIVLPAILKGEALPDKNRTKAFWDKYDHLMKMEIGDAFPATEKTQSTWSYTIREVLKEDTDRKYKFVRARTGLYLKRIS